ncbi:MAG: hypothetical protein AAGL97_04050 [Pseudomonadota bacterium]
MRLLLMAMAALGLSVSQNVHAQIQRVGDNPASDVSQDQIYPASYYNQFAPRTAYDMVLRTPGFQIRAETERRGFGQGGSNVLINGERLTGKSADAVEQLQRVQSSKVEAIEIIDGATSGIPGLSGRVVNVKTRSSTFSGNWSWSPVIRNYTEPGLDRGNVSISGASNNIDYTVTFDSQSLRAASRGPEQVRFSDGSSAIFNEAFDSVFTGPKLSGALRWSGPSGIVANLNSELSKINTNQRDTSIVDGANTMVRPDQSIFDFGFDERSAELNGDLSWPLWSGQAKIYGVYGVSEADRRSTSRDVVAPSGLTQTRFESQADTSETIIRGEYDIAAANSQNWQIAAEYVRNTLNFGTEFFQGMLDGSFTPVPLDDPNTKVAEDRFEVTLTHDRPLGKKLNAQISLGAEYSTLMQSDAQADASRNFFRPKGFASLSYQPSDTMTVTGKIEREVGQLDFLDFTSSIDLEDDFDQTGNPDLVPQQVWRADLSVNKQFASGHILDVTVFGEDISDLVDRIPIGENGDGIGNIPSAKAFGIETSATVKGDALGWRGWEGQFAFELADSSVKDPVEGFDRQLNNQTLRRFDISLAYDPPSSDWALGARLSQSIVSPIYRLRSIDDNYRSPFGSAYIENKNIRGVKVRATVFNATDFSIELDRQIFDARRDSGSLLRTESRQRNFGPYIQFDISGQF